MCLSYHNYATQLCWWHKQYIMNFLFFVIISNKYPKTTFPEYIVFYFSSPCGHSVGCWFLFIQNLKFLLSSRVFFERKWITLLSIAQISLGILRGSRRKRFMTRCRMQWENSELASQRWLVLQRRQQKHVYGRISLSGKIDFYLGLPLGV